MKFNFKSRGLEDKFRETKGSKSYQKSKQNYKNLNENLSENLSKRLS